MKKMFFVFSILAIIVLSSLTVFAIDGDGTEETPFLITNQGELELITDFPDCHFRLANDIELDGTWIPLCKQTTSGYFTGVFDGAGYTISNLHTNTTKGGLFDSNSGTIKDLNITIANEGMTGSGTIAHNNCGTIKNCIVKGNITCDSDFLGGICSKSTGSVLNCEFNGIVNNLNNTGITGGICGSNSSYLMSCSFKGIVKNTSTGAKHETSTSNGGICGYNKSASYPAIIALCTVIGDISTGRGYAGGICGNNFDDIKNSYFIGTIENNSQYTGGITGYNNFNAATNKSANIINCYSAASGIKNGIGMGDANYTANYYDKTVSGLSNTNYGTPKSTAAMKMLQTYPEDWDFEKVWGIDKNTNNGYPYLLREYSNNSEKRNPYTINSIKISDLSGNELEEIPTESFYCEFNITKNDNSKNADSLVIAVYDKAGVLIDLKYMRGTYYQNQTIAFGTIINEIPTSIGTIKGFVWNSISDMTPLSNVMEIKN